MRRMPQYDVSTQNTEVRISRNHIVLLVALLALVSAVVPAVLPTTTRGAAAQTTTQKQEADAPVSPDCGPNWVQIDDPVPPGVGNSSSDGVAVVSANNVWSVGSYQGTNRVRTLVEHWNGTDWQVVSSPNWGTYSSNYLQSVAVSSANDIWAVGTYYNSDSGTGQYLTLIEHYDGSIWSIVSSPSPGAGDNQLRSVVAISASNVWAVGSYNLGFGGDWTLVEHWNGSTWSVVSSPNQSSGDNELYGITALSGSNIWAVGYYQGTTRDRTLVEHYDGSSWAIVSSPAVDVGDNLLYGVSASSAGNVWAVGAYWDSANVENTLAERWNGSAWNVVSSPSPGLDGNELRAVTALSANNVWAVGTYEMGLLGIKTLAEHWNGTSWSAVTSSSPGTDYNYLNAIAAYSADDIWAVGEWNNTGAAGRTLIERYNPCTTPTPTRTLIASRTPTNTPTRTHTPLPTQTPGGPTATPQPPSDTPTANPTQCTLQFADVPNPSTFYTYVQCLACRGIINGYPCGGTGEPCNANNDPYFRPGNNVTRGQIAKIIALSAGISGGVSGQTFEDVPPGSTFYTYVEQLYALQAMNGYPCGGPNEPCNPPNNRPYFRPNNNATRGQLAKIDANVAGYNDPPSGQTFQDVPPASTFYTFTERLVSRGVMNGYACGNPEPCVPPDDLPYFRPNDNVSRGQTSKIAANTFFPACQSLRK